MYTLTLSPQEVRTIRDALERLHSDEVESLEHSISKQPNELLIIMETGANIIAASDILKRLPRVTAAKMQLTFKE